jgi:hypothetical protein
MLPVEAISEKILTIRGKKVILASDLADVYAVTTKALNQAVNRNAAKFPADFAFQLTREEAKIASRLRLQFVTLKRGQHIDDDEQCRSKEGGYSAINQKF